MKIVAQKNIRILNQTLAAFLAFVFVLQISYIGPLAVRVAEAALFNQQINYQGKLTNTSNASVSDGTYHMTFRLYTVATGGSPIWTEDRSTEVGDRVTVSNGLFSVMLGSSTPLTTVNFDQTLYLGVEIGGSGGSPSWDGEMTPRKVIGAVPAAFEADRLDHLSSEQFLRTDAVNSTSTASTFLTITQNGAGNIAEFIGPSSAPAFNVASGGQVNVGTSTGYGRFTVWGAGTGTGRLANFVNSASTTVMSLLDNGSVGIGTTTPFGALNVARALTATANYGTLSVGVGPWDGSSSGRFVGQSAGTMFAVNAPNTSGVSLIDLQTAGGSRFRVTSTGQITAGNGGAQNGSHVSDFALTPTSAINLTAEGGQLFSIGAASFTITGNYATQRFNTFAQPTITAGSALGITSEASTFNIAGAPISAGSATIARSIGLRVNSGTAIASGVASGYGLYVDAPTGATNNYAAAFLGGNVGIGTTSPYAALSVLGETVSSYFTATTSTASIFPYASTTALTVAGTNGLQLASSLNGPLQANNGLVSATSSVGVLYGGTGLSSAPTYGQLLVGNSSGGYTLTATSSIGINSSQWTTSGSDIYYSTGNVGVGTSSPYAKLSVAGQVVGAYFTATTSTASTFPYASTTALSVSGDAYFAGNGIWSSTGNVGIGTSSPYAKLSVAGQIVGGYFTATTTTATSTFMGTLSVGSTTPTSTAVFSVGTSSPLLTVTRDAKVNLPTLPECAYLETGNGGSVACAPVTSYKMGQIYGRFTQEDAAVFFIGDSTASGSNTPRWGQSIMYKWDVPWVGFVGIKGTSTGSPDEGYQAFVAATAVAPGASFADGSGTNDTIFTITERNAATGTFANTFLTNLDRYFRGDWTEDKQMVTRLLLHKPAGTQLTSVSVNNNMSSGNNIPDITSNLSITNTYDGVDTNFNPQNYRPNTYLQNAVNYYFGGSFSMHTAGYEFYAPGKKGFSLVMGGVGGSHTYDWIHQADDARGDWTETQIRNSLGMLSRKINTFILQLGINGSVDESTSDGGAVYKARIEKIIDNWKSDAEAAGGTDIKFLLINPWYTLQDSSEAWPIQRGKVLLQIAHERDYVSFIDLNTLLRDEYGTLWQKTLMEDGIHQNQAGANAIGEITWKEISKGKDASLWSATGREVLANPNLTSGTSWSATNSCSMTGNAATCSYISGTASTITQTSANFANAIIPGEDQWYKFTYGVRGVSGTPSVSLSGLSNLSTRLDLTVGTHTTYFRGTVTPGNFVLTTTMSVGQAFTLDSFSLVQAEDNNTVVNGLLTGGGMTGLKVTSTGNVGIGTTTPFAKLTVQNMYGDSTTSPLFMIASSTNSIGSTYVTRFLVDGVGNTTIGTGTAYARLNVWGLGTGTGMLANFANNASSSVMTLLDNGNVGIGTTSPYAKLSVVGQIVGGYFTATTTTASTLPNASSTLLTVSSNAYFPGSGIWDSSGNVGIGTSTPQWLLNPASASASQLSLSAGAGVSQWAFRNAGANLYFATTTVAGTATSTTAALSIIGTTGNVGISSTSPWRRFSVNGTVAFSGLTSSAVGNAVCITTTNDVTNAGAASCSPSSIRFKENVETLEQGFAIDRLNQLRVVSFDYINGSYSPEDRAASYGMIAEEVELIDPNLVDYGYDGRPLTLKFEKILGLTVQAVQELSQQQRGPGGLLDMKELIERFREFGVEISKGITRIRNLVVDSFTVGSSEKPTGITIFDEKTGKPFCLKVANGKMKTVAGECAEVVGDEEIEQTEVTTEIVDDNGGIDDGGGGLIDPTDPTDNTEVVPGPTDNTPTDEIDDTSDATDDTEGTTETPDDSSTSDVEENPTVGFDLKE